MGKDDIQYTNGLDFGQLEINEDPIKKVAFWLDAMQVDGISFETKRLMDKCLQNDLRNFIEPPEIKFNLTQEQLLKIAFGYEGEKNEDHL